MPTPERTARGGTDPVAAVRAVLDVLAVPVARQVLLLEQALATQMAVFTGAPASADFDPLARQALLAAAGVARPQPGAARRKAAPVKSGEPSAGFGPGRIGAAAAAAAASRAARQPPPAQSLLTGIAAALDGLDAPNGASSRRPAPPAPERAARSATLGALGAVTQTAHAAANALDAVPGTAVTAPVLERIAEIGGALWLQAALSPPGQATSSSNTAGNGGARRARSAPGVADGAARGAGASLPMRPAAAEGAVSREGTSALETVSDALAGIGRLTVELFTAAARAGTPDPLGTYARPAPRAPNVLVPPRAPEPTSRPAGASPAPAASGATLDVDIDALARALRAEAELRGVAL